MPVLCSLFMIFDIRAFVLECLHLYALLMCVRIYTHVFENIHSVVYSTFCMYMIDTIPFLGPLHCVCMSILYAVAKYLFFSFIYLIFLF